MLKQSLLVAFLPAALAAQQAPPVRLINTPDASTKPVLSAVAAVRQLPSGRLLVNDILKRQLVMFDQTLGTATIVADSASGGANSYGSRPGGLIPYLGDSTLFIDPAGLSMFVIDPTGVIARVASVPRSQDANQLGSNLNGSPALDAKGRIVYRGGFAPQRISMAAPPTNGAARTSMGFTMPDPPDSAALVRIDPATRKLDTAAFLKIPKIKLITTQTDKGMSMTTEINPLPLVDDWAVLADGSVAIVRGRDYHVDWVNPDGSVTVSPKLPFDWQRLTDEDKSAVIDSVKSAMEKARITNVGGGKSLADGMAAGGSGNMVIMNFSVGGGDAGGKAGGGAGPSMAPLTFVSLNDMPDYRPAFGVGAARGDLDGNLWIRTSATRAGAIAGPIYDVVNRTGVIVERIQVPSGRSIVGFGKGGIVYMMARDDKGSWIERTHR